MNTRGASRRTGGGDDASKVAAEVEMLNVSEEDQGAVGGAGEAGEVIPQAGAQQDSVGPKHLLVRDQLGLFIRDVIREEVRSLTSLASSSSTGSGHDWTSVGPTGQGVIDGHHSKTCCVPDHADQENTLSRPSLFSEQDGLVSLGAQPGEQGKESRGSSGPSWDRVCQTASFDIPLQGEISTLRGGMGNFRGTSSL